MKTTVKIAVMAFILSFLLGGCGESSSKAKESEPVTPSYQVYFDIAFEGNFLFDKYDVDVCFDKETLDTISHGAYYTKLLESVEEGTHTIRFHKHGDESVKGDYEVEINNDTTFKCTIHAKGSEVKIDDVQTINSIEGNEIPMIDTVGMNLDEAREALVGMGFVNVTSEAKDDVIFVESNWTVISQNIEPEKKYDKNTEIILTCEHISDDHSTAEDKPAKEKTDDAQPMGGTADTAKEAPSMEETSEEAALDSETAKNAVISNSETSKEKESIFDLAYKISNYEYSVYYLIDQKNSQVTTFSTNDTSILKGDYTGTLEEGIDVAYDEENHELIKWKEKGNDEIILVSPESDAAFEYAAELRKTDVKEAEQKLNNPLEESENEEAATIGDSMVIDYDEEVEDIIDDKDSLDDDAELEAEVQSLSANDLSIVPTRSITHASYDSLILGNDETVTLEVSCSNKGVSLEDIYYSYDKEVIEVTGKESTDANGFAYVNLYISGIAEGSTELNIYVKEELDQLKDDAPKQSRTVKKLNSVEGRIVYKTPTGKRYHFSEACAGDNSIATTVYDATVLGLGPCGTCAQ